LLAGPRILSLSTNDISTFTAGELLFSVKNKLPKTPVTRTEIRFFLWIAVLPLLFSWGFLHHAVALSRIPDSVITNEFSTLKWAAAFPFFLGTVPLILDSLTGCFGAF